MPEVTLEEFEATATAEPPKPTAAETKIDVSDLPDYAGKTVADLSSELEGFKKALRVSEESRLTMKAAMEAGRSVEQPVVPVAPAGPAVKTREELREMMQEDPMAVLDYMTNHLSANLGRHLEDRFAPMVAGNISSKEAQFRAKYPTEFELFAGDIEAVKKQVRQEILSTDVGWEDLLSYVRGRPGNTDKLVDAKVRAATAVLPVNARAREAANTGFTTRETTVVPANTGPITRVDQLDATQLEICRVMNIDPSEYIKYM